MFLFIVYIVQCAYFLYADQHCTSWTDWIRP